MVPEELDRPDGLRQRGRAQYEWILASIAIWVARKNAKMDDKGRMAECRQNAGDSAAFNLIQQECESIPAGTDPEMPGLVEDSDSADDLGAAAIGGSESESEDGLLDPSRPSSRRSATD